MSQFECAYLSICRNYGLLAGHQPISGYGRRLRPALRAVGYLCEALKCRGAFSFRLHHHFTDKGSISRSRAASDGAIDYHLNNLKTAYASWSIGVEFYDTYNGLNKLHSERLERGSGTRKTQSPSGRSVIGPKFKCFIKQVSKTTPREHWRY